MSKTKFLLFSLLMSLACSTVSAQSYPVVMNEGQRVVTGFQSFLTDDDRIFANALKWGVTNLCEKERDGLFDIRVNKKDFSFNASFEYEQAGKVKYRFNCKGNIKVQDRKLVYTLYDISYSSSSIFSFSSATSLDRLSPEKKPKHQEIITAFQTLSSKLLNSLFEEVGDDKCASVSHWDEINIQKAVKGMNEDECLLAFGKPNTQYEDNNNRLQWSYGLNFILIFTQGQLETILR